jgi:hypothetical protein
MSKFWLSQLLMSTDSTLVIDEHLIILFSFGVCKFINFFLQFNLAVGKTYFSVNILIKPVLKSLSNPGFFLSLVHHRQRFISESLCFLRFLLSARIKEVLFGLLLEFLLFGLGHVRIKEVILYWCFSAKYISSRIEAH